MISEPDDHRLDQSLRGKFDDFELTPGAPVWAGIEQRLTPPPRLRPRRRPLLVPLLFVLTAFVAGLGGWLLPHGAGRPPRLKMGHSGSAAAGLGARLAKSGSVSANADSYSVKSGSVSVKSDSYSAKSGSVLVKSGSVSANTDSHLAKPGSHLAKLGSISASTPPARPARKLEVPGRTLEAATAAAVVARPLPADSLGAVAAAVSAEGTPATLHPLAALEHQTLEQLPSLETLAAGPREAAARQRLVGTLRTERAELLRLQRRTDSLLLALGDLPGAPALAARPDSAQPATRNPQAASPKWSLLLTAAPEQNTLPLQGPADNPLTALRTGHETGRAGFSAALLAEYRLAPRLSVGGGVGYTTFGADLRITNKHTDVLVKYDTTTTHTVNTYTSTHQTYSIRLIQVPQLSPVFNGSGQVIRYDTVYVPRPDTLRTTTVQHDTVRTNHTTVTPNISRKETLTTRTYQPQYRFFTVPVLLRYRLATPGLSRLWTDVSLGAQLQFFLGGTQVVTNDGENFRTETVRAGEGPFRRLNVALSGALALNYALTPRLSVSVAPSLRWQALSLYRPETGLRQQATATGLLFGVRFGL